MREITGLSAERRTTPGAADGTVLAPAEYLQAVGAAR